MAVILASELKWYGSGAGNIGGTISGSEVVPASLFDTVSGDEAYSGDTEYRIVYFRNTSANSGGLISPVIWISTQTPGGDSIEIAVQTAKNTAAGTMSDESTWNATGWGSFSAPSTKGGGLALPSGPYAQNDYVGIGIKRIVPGTCAAYNSNTFTLTVEGDSGA